MALLEVRDLCVNYGAIKAVRGISFDVEEGKVVTLIGANGSGKTTTMKTIIGVNKAASGSIVFDGEDITSLPSHQIIQRGIAISPEGRQVFPRMSVQENLNMGAYICKDKKIIEEGIERAFTLFPILEERKNQSAGTLSGGEQQMLAVARALMGNPRLLIMDEPSLGLAPLIVKNIFLLIEKISQMGITILLVEQNAKMALTSSDRGYVLQTGKIVLEGESQELLDNEQVRNAYLGG
ncbi:MAG: ABC transporter ATP-binding protein [Lachnospiraceae bacterium]|nr:ABC transporter ATP-binding protein [Lachnospiraceae bacterium]